MLVVILMTPPTMDVEKEHVCITSHVQIQYSGRSGASPLATVLAAKAAATWKT